MPSGELDGLALKKLDRNVEARDVDNDVGAYVARSRRAYVNVVEGELITRDAQRRPVSLGEAAESESAEIVPDAAFEAGDDGHKAGRIDSRHEVVSSRSSASRIWKLFALSIASPGTVGRRAIVDGGF